MQDLVCYCVNHVHFNVCLHTGRVALLDNIFKLCFILHYNNVYTLGSAHPIGIEAYTYVFPFDQELV